MINDNEFEWDERKALSNYNKHGVLFEIAKLVFRDPLALENEGWSEEDHEPRYEILGVARDRILFVAYTIRGSRIRIISAREAEPYERRRYHEDSGWR